MCTIVMLRRPGHPWPLLIAANRDEMADRPWISPGRHWPDQPAVVAGKDVLGGGTWLGVNDRGVAAAVLNRINTLGPAPGRRSRGGLPLLALAEPDAERAARAVAAAVDPRAYRPFNMVIADARAAFCIRGTDDGDPATPAALAVEAVPAGLSMVTAYDRNDLRSPRIRRYLPRFASAPPPRPELADWREWMTLLSARAGDPGAGPGGGMTVVTTTGFGTVSSSLLAAPGTADGSLLWLFAPGRAGETRFAQVQL